jgi:hypothetical protein
VPKTSVTTIRSKHVTAFPSSTARQELPVAQKVIYQLIDDLDESPLDDGDGETVIFGLDGVEYEIDLSASHARDLRDALSPYVEAGRPRATRSTRSTSSSPSGSGGPATRGSAPVKRDLESVRAWANDNGFRVSTRGRIPAAVSEAYHAAHK